MQHHGKHYHADSPDNTERAVQHTAAAHPYSRSETAEYGFRNIPQKCADKKQPYQFVETAAFCKYKAFFPLLFRNLAANAFSPSFSRLGKALVIRFWIPRKIAFPSRSETSCIPAAISSIRAVFLSCRMAPATDRKSPVVITSRIMPSSLTRKVGIMEISGAKNGWTKVMISAAPIPHRAENCGHMYPPKLCL